jgi:hypothetical protein
MAKPYTGSVTLSRTFFLFLKTPPQPKASKSKEATAKKGARKFSDGVVEPKGKAKGRVPRRAAI